VYNFWQGKGHVRGYWRKAALESYRTAAPEWATVLDLDELAQAEKANWFLKGITTAEPAEHRCLLALSDGARTP